MSQDENRQKTRLHLTVVSSILETKVIWRKAVDKQLERVPRRILKRFWAWINWVQDFGIREARKNPGFHDEPLRGNREGQRSVRLNRSYRAFYRETKDGDVELIEVLEVNKHDY